MRKNGKGFLGKARRMGFTDAPCWVGHDTSERRRYGLGRYSWIWRFSCSSRRGRLRRDSMGLESSSVEG